MHKNICLVAFLYFNTSLAMETNFTNGKDHLDLFATLLKQAHGDICDECLDRQNNSDSEDSECSDCSESGCPFCELLSNEYLPCGNLEIKKQAKQLINQITGVKSKMRFFAQIHNLSGKEVLDFLNKKHIINEVKTKDNYIKLENLETILKIKNCHITLAMQKYDTKGCIIVDKTMTAGNKKQNVRIVYLTKDSHVSIYVKKS